MRTERNAVLRRQPQNDHPNMELKGIYSFMQDIIREIGKLRDDISRMREDLKLRNDISHMREDLFEDQGAE